MESSSRRSTTAWTADCTKPLDLGLIEIGDENGTEAFPPRYRLVYDALNVAVVPVTRRITLADTHEFPPYSLTVLRFKTKKD